MTLEEQTSQLNGMRDENIIDIYDKWLEWNEKLQHSYMNNRNFVFIIW